MNRELLDVQVDLETEEPEIKLPTYAGHRRSKRIPKNTKRDKKAFLSEQCKETEENNRIGKTRDLSRKLKFQGNVSCKDGHNEEQKWYRPNRSRRD